MSKTVKRSIINKYFTKDIYFEIYKITMINDLDNIDKGYLIIDYLKSTGLDFSPLGSGTNRMAILLDGYAVKIALDKDGMIDNRREMLYTKDLQPYVIKVYECTPTGLIAVTEYVSAFTNKADLLATHVVEAKKILSEISQSYLVGDVGITEKNYGNWGTRKTDGSLCILDYAYIYSVKYTLFSCTNEDCENPNSLLQYDNNFVNLICPSCGTKYSFAMLRQRITRKQQEMEIGDIKRLGYNITKDNEEVDIIPEFEPKDESKKKEVSEEKKEKEEIKKLIEEYHCGKFKNN